MKKYLLIAVLEPLSFFCRSQTRGTNAIGLGMNFQTQKTESPNFYSEQSDATYSLGYGFFLKENQKAGLTVFFSRYTGLNEFTAGGGNPGEPGVSWSYGDSFDYQKFYRLHQKFYVFAGVRTGYKFSQKGYQANGAPLNRYSASVHGGLSWTLFNRLAPEAYLLSADLVQTSSKSGYGTK